MLPIRTTSGIILARSSAVSWQSGGIQARPQIEARKSFPPFAPQGSNRAFKKKNLSLTVTEGLSLFQLQTPLCCHVEAEMIRIGVLLMWLAGSAAGDRRQALVCAPESVPACQNSEHHSTSSLRRAEKIWPRKHESDRAGLLIPVGNSKDVKAFCMFSWSFRWSTSKENSSTNLTTHAHRLETKSVGNIYVSPF